MTLPLVIVVAVAENGVIGRDNRLLWHLRSDLRRFRDLTWGKPMIMGRKTFQSIGRPLPGRESVVLTRDPGFFAEGIYVAHDWREAVATAERLAASTGADTISVVGGAEIYALALPHVKRIHWTQVHASPDGDAIFPSFNRSAFRETSRESRPVGPNDEHAFDWIDFERRV